MSTSPLEALVSAFVLAIVAMVIMTDLVGAWFEVTP